MNNDKVTDLGTSSKRKGLIGPFKMKFSIALPKIFLKITFEPGSGGACL